MKKGGALFGIMIFLVLAGIWYYMYLIAEKTEIAQEPIRLVSYEHEMIEVNQGLNEQTKVRILNNRSQAMDFDIKVYCPSNVLVRSITTRLEAKEMSDVKFMIKMDELGYFDCLIKVYADGSIYGAQEFGVMVMERYELY